MTISAPDWISEVASDWNDFSVALYGFCCRCVSLIADTLSISQDSDSAVQSGMRVERMSPWPSQCASVGILANILFQSNKGEYRIPFESIYMLAFPYRSGYPAQSQSMGWSISESNLLLVIPPVF
jgi:hypothetical protein